MEQGHRGRKYLPRTLVEGTDGKGHGEHNEHGMRVTDEPGWGKKMVLGQFSPHKREEIMA